MIDGLQHVGTNHKCSVCQCDFTDDEGGIQGYLGIIPVAFCPTCYAGIFDMVEQLEDREWTGLDDEDYIKAYELCDFDKEAAFEFFEAKLKELNS
jgi:hypothetical protein